MRTVVTAALLAYVLAGSARAQATMSIVSVRRAKTYGRGAALIRPVAGFLVLVVTLNRIDEETWKNGSLYLTSGTERFELKRRVNFATTTDRVAVFIVPAYATEFDLHVIGRPTQVHFGNSQPVLENILAR